MTRILALDYGHARCGCAVSDPTATVVSPLAIVERAATRRGRARLVRLVDEQEVERVVVGLPLTLAGEEGAQAAESRAFAESLGRLLRVPVELHDERLTTRMAERRGGHASADSRAAAHLLESYLARVPRLDAESRLEPESRSDAGSRLVPGFRLDAESGKNRRLTDARG